MPVLWLYALLTVLVESHPSDPALLGVALQSCSEALSDAACVELATPGAASEKADFVAHLTWRDPLHARVEVQRGEAMAGAREIAFVEADSPAERYRALGLVVASYVLAQRLAEPVAMPEPEPEPERVFTPPPHASARFGLDLALLGGPALDRGPYRVGGMARALVRPFHGAPGLALLLGARGTHRPGGPSLTWLGLSLGIGGRLQLAPWLSSEARLEWVSQRLFASAVGASGARDRGERYRHGGQLGLELLVRASAHLFPFIGVDVAHLRPRVRVLVAGREVGEERMFEATLLLGTRIAW